MRIASALSTEPQTAGALQEACDRVSAELDASPDLAVVFCSSHHLRHAPTVARGVADRLRARHVIGCSGQSVIGDGREVEDGPALSVWAAVLPGAGIEGFHSRFVRTSQGAGFTGFPDLEGRTDVRAVVMLADPISYPAHALLQAAAGRFAAVPFIGGMASGRETGEHRLFRDGEVLDAGAVGVVLSGDLEVRTVVSQGCRPIGKPYVVTKADGQVLHELGGSTAIARLQETMAEADPAERAMAGHGLHLGVVIDEQRDEFERGDFLIRNVHGGDPDEGTLVVGEAIEVGRTVQFHVRDAATADEDLRELLAALGPRPAGGLLFTCNGRGSHLFALPDHDAGTIRNVVGDVPVAGFFCNGEIGPVGPRSFLHGFTASAAFFG